jgi:hypothetical protein
MCKRPAKRAELIHLASQDKNQEFVEGIHMIKQTLQTTF